jgi:ABC-type glycerol-3-phosphate transport system substrate-binding protein
MARISRRRLLKISGAGALVARSCGCATMFALGRAPAHAQRAKLHWLRGADFVPASDRLLKTAITAECEKALGIKLTVETVNLTDIQARITSAIQAGAGPDVICAGNNWPQLYAESVADVSDVAEEIGEKQGGYYQVSRAVATVGSKWIAVPWCTIGGRIVYRRSWFEEVGYSEFPQTWEEYRAAGEELKAKGHPLGQTLGHTFGDGPGFWYPYLWSWGGKEIDADGKTVVLNSRETVESVKFAVGFWKDAFDEGGLAWDDSSNNRAFLSGTVSATNNPASIYLEAKLRPNTYLTEKGVPMRDDAMHAPIPRGPGGQFTLPVPFSNVLMSYSKDQKLAKHFVRWVSSKEIFEQWFTSQQGFANGATLDWERDPVWEVDPNMLSFKGIPRTGHLAGYAGTPGRAAAEALTKSTIVDMYAKAVQGVPPETSVRLAHEELTKIYA